MFDGRPERGLLMTGPLVVETIEGRKTNTRRIGERYRKWKRGDLVYVRETWAPYRQRTMTQFPDGSTKSYWESDGEGDPAVLYRADMRVREGWTNRDGDVRFRNPKTTLDKTDAERWRPGIHMPKWAARVWLELTADVTYEPVQDIDEEGAKAEGVDPRVLAYDPVANRQGYIEITHREAFASLWDTINSKRGPEDDPERYTWARNPEVAVIRYRVVSTTGRPT